MKKILFILVLLTVVSVLAACVPYPDEPKEILPFCQDQYEENLALYSWLPPSFIGGCVSTWQSDNYAGYASLCNYEEFRVLLGNEFDTTIENRAECLQFLKTMPQ